MHAGICVNIMCTADVCRDILCTADIALQTRGGGGSLALACILIYVLTLCVPLMCV
jgi:hypothetical protein